MHAEGDCATETATMHEFLYPETQLTFILIGISSSQEVDGVKWILVMIGGSLGAALRYAVNLLAVRFWGSGFPWGTLAVNLAGCLLIGLIFGLAERAAWVSPSMRLFFVTGFLGALTTFSSFAIETVNTASTGSLALATTNVLANNIFGLALVIAGLRLARLF